MRFALCVAVVLAMVGMASADQTLSPNWAPTGFYPQAPLGITTSLINDGGFEQGPPPSSAWTETSTQPCEWIMDISSAWGVAPFEGSYCYWSGGYCYGLANTSSVTQHVTVPAGSDLTFYYISYRPDADDPPADTDHAYVKVNGTELWTLAMTQANDTYPNWVGPISVGLGAYSGQAVDLSLGNHLDRTVTGNVCFDMIEWTAPTAVQSATWSSVKSLYR